jgi:hypothetical protein
MPLITSKIPDTWEDLEEIVTAILKECGMCARRNATLALPRGTVDVDVLAEENVGGIVYQTICECKNWRTNVPKEVVHAFRTVMQETGAHRGYVISREGFQSGAGQAAKATNIELVTFAQFQEIYFDKWINARIWALEKEADRFNTYYEPIGQPGYGLLKDAQERAAYDEVWNKYEFAGLMLHPFWPYLRLVRPYPYSPLPFDVSDLERRGISVPADITTATAYREFFEMLARYVKAGLRELRAVNPITRGTPADSIERED